MDGRRRPLPARAAVRARRRADRLRRQDAARSTTRPPRPSTASRCRREGRKPQARAEPTLADVRNGLDRLAQAWTLSGAEPTSTAGRPSYTVRIAPEGRRRPARRRRAGLGRRQRRAAARRRLRPGPGRPGARAQGHRHLLRRVDDSDLRVPRPGGREVVDVDAAGRPRRRRARATGRDAAWTPSQKRLASSSPLRRSSPACRASEVRLVRFGDEAGALSAYGEGLGGDRSCSSTRPDDAGRGRAACRPAAGQHRRRHGHRAGHGARHVRDASSAAASATRSIGSVPPVAAENAARGLR